MKSREFPVEIQSPNIKYESESIKSIYTYESSQVKKLSSGKVIIIPEKVNYEIVTDIRCPKLGLMIVGLGGNNGSTLVGMIIANKYGLKWHTKVGIQEPNFLGSISQVGTLPIGKSEDGNEVFLPIKDIIPMVDPMNVEIDGWDISDMNLGDALKRSCVFEWELQEKLHPFLSPIKPRPGAFYQDFYAANQKSRANNLIQGTRKELIQKLRMDIRDFKENKKLDKIIVLWIGNTECMVDVIPGLNDTWINLEKSIERDAFQISPSTLYAIAAIQENCGFINGSPQNTLVPGVLELAESLHVFACGDDLKTGQTKLKSTLIEYLIGAGLRPESIVSYNHLGNNDGKNLSAPHTFRSKEKSKRGISEDMKDMNNILFPDGSPDPDHCIVIKYVPFVGDSKRAMDEYISSIGMGGSNTLVIHNTCEDSLLAAPIMLDLVLFMELFQRMIWKKITTDNENGNVDNDKINLDIGNILGYWLKAPIHSNTHSLFRQRSLIENIIKAALSLPPTSHLTLNQQKKQKNSNNSKQKNGATN